LTTNDVKITKINGKRENYIIGKVATTYTLRNLRKMYLSDASTRRKRRMSATGVEFSKTTASQTCIIGVGWINYRCG
jgi:hypothetical protein